MGKFLQGIIVFIYSLMLVQEGMAQKVSPIKITASNAASYRDSLKLKVFGSINFPYNIYPDSIITNVDSIDHFNYNGFPYASIMYPSGNLDSIDRFVVTLENDPLYFPDKVKVFLFHPHNSNGKLFIYHSGHCAGVAPAEDVFSNNANVAPGLVIPAMVELGYTVLAVPMLNYRANTQEGVYCNNNGHNELFTDGIYPYPLQYFFKPLIASLNRLGRSNFDDIYMCGLSGGGWMSSVYPAMDSSISISFPVAGSWPMPVRAAYYPALGDYEQTYPPIFSELLDYHDLYTLACLAPARKMLQVNNRYDPCCFSGPVAHIYYVDSVRNALQGTGAVFKFYLDETGDSHSISAKALDVMLAFISSEEARLQNLPPDTIVNGMYYAYNIPDNFINVNGAPVSGLTYSMLKAPAWLNMDNNTGLISGMVPSGSIVIKPDTISFKVEDDAGRFVVYNYQLTRKRQAPYFFTNSDEENVLYYLPPFANSLGTVDNSIAAAFQFNNPLKQVLTVEVVNNSVIRLQLNMPVSANDSVSYHGTALPAAISFNNGRKLENFSMTAIHSNALKKNIAVAGMIRFNKNTRKFEYFTGLQWKDMGQ